MAGPNPVSDKLWNFPGQPAWQTDAETGDTNLPQNTDIVKVTTPTGLAPELRSIKNETRQFSLDPAWINYMGWDGAPSLQPASFNAGIAPVGVGLTLQGDWVTPGIAIVGRRIRATFADNTRAVATIAVATPGGGVTTVTLDQPILGTKSLSYVEFSALGSALAWSPTTPNNLNAFPLDLVPASNTDPTLVVPVENGGTGRTAAQTFAAGSDVQGLLNTDQLNLSVVGLQGRHVNDVQPDLTAPDTVLHWDIPGAGGWSPASLASIFAAAPGAVPALATALNISATIAPDNRSGVIGIASQGTPILLQFVVIAPITAAASPSPGTAGVTTIPVPWPQPFPNALWALWGITDDAQTFFVHDPSQPNQILVSNLRNTSQLITATVVGIGF